MLYHEAPPLPAAGKGTVNTVLYLVTAFKTEARPLIAHYGLEPRPRSGAFPVYENADCALVISGPGKTAAAKAAAHLYAGAGEPRGGAWVNVGVAGHDHLPLGTVVVAHKIVDAATGRAWYPPQALRHSLTGAVLHTVDAPETGYRDGALYDMEASGFYPAAAACTTRELVQCCKIVSDNRAQPLEQFTPRKAGELIERAVPVLAGFIGQLSDLARTPARETGKDLAPFLDRWHFSVTQRHRLRRNLQRWAALRRGEDCPAALFQHCRNATAVLTDMDRQLNADALEWPGRD